MKSLTHTQRYRSMRRPGTYVAVAAMSACVLAACGASTLPKPRSSAPSKTAPTASASLQMWIAGNALTKPIYVSEAAAYSKSHPGVTVNVTDLPGPAYTQKLDAALAANKPPAIYQLFAPGPEMQTLVSGHKLADLTGILSSNPSFKSRIIASALAQGQLNGKQYGIPYNIFQEAVVLYSKPDFKKAGIASVPTTWSALTADIAKLKAAGLIPVSISGTEADNWYGWWLENYEVRLAGVGVTQDLKRGDLAALDSPPVVRAAAAMQSLVKAGAFEPGYTTASEANDIPYALLGTGKAAMLLYGAFTPNFVENVSPSFVKNGQMGWFSFPAVSGGTGNQIVDLSSTPMLVVNRDMATSAVKAAEKFLASFVYSPGQVRALAKTGNVGPAAAAGPIVAAIAPAYLKAYMSFEVNQALHAKSAFIGWSNYIPTSATSTWNSLKESLFTLKITPAQFAQRAAKI